jgi:hypothetical protein
MGMSGFRVVEFSVRIVTSFGESLHRRRKPLRIRGLTTALLTAGLLAAGAGSAAASPVSAPEAAGSCTLTVTDFYYSIGMQTASAKLSGGCTGYIDIVMEQAPSPAGPFQEVDTLYYLQQSADGTAALGYFTDPVERGFCRAKATANGLTAYSPNAVSC